MKTLPTLLAAGALLAVAASTSQAAEITLDGLARFHNDKIVIDFSSATAGTVRIWTDSWLAGLNFDPRLSLFLGQDLIAGDDDSGSLVDPSAGFYDAGLVFDALAGSRYSLVLTASSNDPLGSRLADGFSYDLATPILLSDWNQPSYDVNANDQKGGFWRVQFSGVDTASVVPEPGTLLLMLAGLGLAGRVRRPAR